MLEAKDSIYTRKLLLETNVNAAFDFEHDLKKSSLVLSITFGKGRKYFVLDKVPYVHKYLHGGSKR